MHTQAVSLLGCVPGMMNVTMELIEDSLGITHFDVLKNMDVEVGDEFQKAKHWEIAYYNAHNEQWPKEIKKHFAFLVVGTESKPIVFDYFRNQLEIKPTQFPIIVHPSSVISASTSIDFGVQIEALTVISACTNIGFGVNIKRGCSIGHHCTFGEFVTINPGVTISSNVKIGKSSLIGSGVVIKDHITIGANSIIGAGSVVVKDIPDNVIAFGNPCTVVKQK